MASVGPAPSPQSSDSKAVSPDPVSRIQAILAAETPQASKPAKAPEQAPPEQEQPAPAEGEAHPETEAEPQADPGENQQVEGAEAPPEREVAEIPLEQLHAIELEVTVKGDDGKDVAEKVSIKALQEGYMRQKDYSRKTAEVARQREEVGEKVRQAIESERSQYTQNLQTLHVLVVETAAQELKDVNWNDLAANNPLEYVRVRNRADQVANALQTIQEKMKEVDTKRQADQKEATAKQVAKSREVLQADIPNWGEQLYQSVLKAGEPVGYTLEETRNWVDPRAIKLLHKAHLYDQLQAGKPPAGKKTVVVPKALKPGASAETSQAQQRNSEAMKRLRDKGTIEDAAAVIRGRM